MISRTIVTFACCLLPATTFAQDYQHGAYFGAEGAISSTNTGTNPFNGLNINEHVGADRFYNEGYTGTRARVVNVEGGHIWNGHESLGHVTQQFDALQTYTNNGLAPGNLGQVDRHATWVGHVIGGRENGGGYYQQGIAHGADLWSAAIATSYGSPPWSNNWGWNTGHAFTEAYANPTLTGFGGQTADVVNSSWGFANQNSASVMGGNDLFSVTADAIAQQSRSTFVFAAGNEGPNSNTVRAPGNGYNGIVVGALQSDTSQQPYSTISSFSSRGPQRYNGPDGNFGLVRARVDITAPGQNMTLAFYGGLTGGNVGGSDPSGGATNWYTFNAQGTSFAAPIVAGGATLLADVAYDRFAGNVVNARDGQVIKAVLLNAAAKPQNWNNGQQNVGGTVTTTQALDYTYGAGILDLNKAFDQYTAGTTDVAGVGGGDIEAIGWDYGVIDENQSTDYEFAKKLAGGSEFTATLNWFVGRSWTGNTFGGSINSSDDYFTNLSLELWSMENGLADSLIAQSDAAFINTEHFSLLIPETDEYLLRVNWLGERYDFVNNSSQTYGLAWYGTAIPEPSTFALLALGGTLAILRRRRS